MGTFFYLSFKTSDEFESKNRRLIDITKMLRDRKDKVQHMLDLIVKYPYCWVF